MPLRLLDERVSSRLRSGVAIASVAQCVSELVDNAIDAESKCIAVRVDISKYRIQVIDNGVGVARQDLNLIGQRYATSKCHTLADLDRGGLGHLGYRGEALASLISCSGTVEITSRHHLSQQTFSKLFYHGSPAPVVASSAQTGRPSVGTTVTVHDFFHNLPVRRRGMSPALEMERIRHALQATALAHPSISFSLRDDQAGECVLQTRRTNSVLRSFGLLFGPSKARGMREVPTTCNVGFEMSGYVSVDSHHNKSLQFVYVNKRLVKRTPLHSRVNALMADSLVLRRPSSGRGIPSSSSSSLSSKWQGRGEGNGGSPRRGAGDRHAVYVLMVRCPRSECDLCLEPAKTLVEFRDWEGVLECLGMAVGQFLTSHALTLGPGVGTGVGAECERQGHEDEGDNEGACRSKGEYSGDGCGVSSVSSGLGLDEGVDGGDTILCDVATDVQEMETSCGQELAAKTNISATLRHCDSEEPGCEPAPTNPCAGLQPNSGRQLGDHCVQETALRTSFTAQGLHTGEKTRVQDGPLDASVWSSGKARGDTLPLPRKQAPALHLSRPLSSPLNSRSKASKLAGLLRGEQRKAATSSLHKTPPRRVASSSPSCAVDGSQRTLSSVLSRAHPTMLSSLHFPPPPPTLALRPAVSVSSRHTEQGALAPATSSTSLPVLGGHALLHGHPQILPGLGDCPSTAAITTNTTTTTTSSTGTSVQALLKATTASCTTSSNTSIRQDLWRVTDTTATSCTTTSSTASICHDLWRVTDAFSLREPAWTTLDIMKNVPQGPTAHTEVETHHGSCADLASLLSEADHTPSGGSLVSSQAAIPSANTLQGNGRDLTLHGNGDLMCQDTVLPGEAVSGGDSGLSFHGNGCGVQNELLTPGASALCGSCAEQEQGRVDSSGDELLNAARCGEKEEREGSIWKVTTDPITAKKFYVHSRTGNCYSHIPPLPLPPPPPPPPSELQGSSLVRAAPASPIPSSTHTPAHIAWADGADNEEGATCSSSYGARPISAAPHLSHDFQHFLPPSRKRLRMDATLDAGGSGWFLGSAAAGGVFGGVAGGGEGEGEEVVTGEGGGGGREFESLLRNWTNPAFLPSQVGILSAAGSRDQRRSIKVHNVINQYKFTRKMLDTVKVLGQVDKKFIACMLDTNSTGVRDLLVLFDQHAAHERVRLEALQADLYESSGEGEAQPAIKSSRVCPPLRINLTPAEAKLARTFKKQFEAFGVGLVQDASGSVGVVSLPSVLMEREASEVRRGRPSVALDLVQDMIVKHLEVLQATSGGNSVFPASLTSILNSQACHSAIKFGDPLTDEECSDLIRALSKCKLPFQCAHGRPSLVPILDVSMLKRREQPQEAGPSNLCKKLSAKLKASHHHHHQ